MEQEALYEAIAKVLSVYIKEIKPESTFYGDLGADSIDMMQILECVEENLGFEIKGIELDKIVTVQDALDIIEKSKNM